MTEQNYKNFISPGGVRWSVGSHVPKDVSDFQQEAKEPTDHSIDATVNDPGVSLESLKKIKYYLTGQGIGQDILSKFNGIKIARLQGEAVYFHPNAWWLEADAITVEEDVSKHVAAHELSHAVSRNSIHLGNSGRVTRKSGVATDTALMREDGRSQETYLQLFNFLNEMITDEIAVRATESGHSTETQKRIDAFQKITATERDPMEIRKAEVSLDRFLKRRGMLRESQALFNTLMESVATSESAHGGTLNTKEKVWRAFLHSYFYSWSQDLKRALRGTLGPDILKVLSLIRVEDLALDTQTAYELQHSRLGDIKRHGLNTLTDNLQRYFSRVDDDPSALGTTILTTLRQLRVKDGWTEQGKGELAEAVKAFFENPKKWYEAYLSTNSQPPHPILFSKRHMLNQFNLLLTQAKSAGIDVSMYGNAEELENAKSTLLELAKVE